MSINNNSEFLEESPVHLDRMEKLNLFSTSKRIMRAGVFTIIGLTSPTINQQVQAQISASNKIEINTSTRQDSLDLLENTNELLAYYSKYKQNEEELNTVEIFKKIEEARVNFSIKNNKGEIRTNRAYPDTNITMADYSKEIDEYTFYQRESECGILDLDSPMGLYNKRIIPVKIIRYKNTKIQNVLYGDKINIAMYAPLQVTPWDMLSEEQKEERIIKYGVSGTPFGASVLTLEGEKSPKPVSETETRSDTQPQIHQSKYGNSERYILSSGKIYQSYTDLVEAHPKFLDSYIYLVNFGKLPPNHK